ncbi:flagellar basal body P-ring protein FlgI [Parasphingorhabdus flavimaris]|uniref:Flagellar P-ring protein n=1 Tax=Parasphingorhabdus flavimaris TaxID=266812 RepID=A0ABX2MZI9_9SPHN|nr:flagellar basal body P-ring protein FlgI [Parasphingorhabdus flavimaris]NVD26853.1 flagellar basal body P-ring protein FlgI [Parasphingorhabdus flavimaris]
MTQSSRIFRSIRWLATFFALVSAAVVVTQPVQAERIKDIGTFAGLRSNQLVGYGVVVGLAGTGDDSLEYATVGLKGVANRFGLTLPPGVNPASKNAAAVLVTAEMPAFAKPGQRLDITVSAIGKAKSLRGGTLILMPLYGADQQIYAMAQGNLAVGGLGVSAADGSKLTVNVPSVGRIPGGASIERTVATGFESDPFLSFNLTDADLTTSLRVADAINEALQSQQAIAADAVTVRIAAPPGAQERVMLMGKIENLIVKPADAPARIIVNARTGTVVINGAVRIGPAAVSHGKLTVRVEENPTVVQPAPLSRGRTAVEQNSDIAVDQPTNLAFEIGRRASLAEIVETINSLGVPPSDLTAILEGLKQAGALSAELIII